MVSCPGRRNRWYVLPRIIFASRSSSNSRGRIPFTVACVPTGMKTGVSTSPCAVWRMPARAPVTGHTAWISKPNTYSLYEHNVKVHRDRVAIFGSGGQLGVELKSEFNARGYEVSGFERSTVDITDQAAVDRALARCDPAIVINAAAYNQVDVAEKEPQAALLVNALAVRNL